MLLRLRTIDHVCMYKVQSVLGCLDDVFVDLLLFSGFLVFWFVGCRFVFVFPRGELSTRFGGTNDTTKTKKPYPLFPIQDILSGHHLFVEGRRRRFGFTHTNSEKVCAFLFRSRGEQIRPNNATKAKQHHKE